MINLKIIIKQNNYYWYIFKFLVISDFSGYHVTGIFFRNDFSP